MIHHFGANRCRLAMGMVNNPRFTSDRNVANILETVDFLSIHKIIRNVTFAFQMSTAKKVVKMALLNINSMDLMESHLILFYFVYHFYNCIKCE